MLLQVHVTNLLHYTSSQWNHAECCSHLLPKWRYNGQTTLCSSLTQQHFSSKNNIPPTHLNVEAELLKAFEQSFFIAGHKGLQVRVDGWTHLCRLLLNLQLDTEIHTHTHTHKQRPMSEISPQSHLFLCKYNENIKKGTHSSRMLFMSNVKNFFLPSSSNRRDAYAKRQVLNRLK